ncbi:MAG: hypothetical protein AB1491_07840 [Thermodesulfobacteriota bacterium]
MLQDRLATRLPEKYLPWLLLGLSGLIGLYVNIAYNSTWQTPVEAGQILAGLVHYDKTNLQYIYTLKTWTVLNQISALVLLAGFDENTASLVIVGLIGAVSLMALTAVIYALSKNFLLALTAPLFISLVWPDFGVIYPISYLQMFRHSTGLFGLVFVVLVLGLFSGGYRRAGSFCLGVAPAVHFTLGAWCILIIALVLALDQKDLRQDLSGMAKYFFLGLLMTGVSFGNYYWETRELRLAGFTDNQEIIVNYLKNFDVHRRPVNFLHAGFYTGLIGAIISLIILLYKKGAEVNSPFFLKIFLVNFLLAGLIAVPSHFPDRWLPLQMLMPGRFININVVMFFPLLLGLLGRTNNHTIDRLDFAFLVLASLLLKLFFRITAISEINLAGFSLNYLKLIFAVALAASVVSVISTVSPDRFSGYLENLSKPIGRLYAGSLLALTAVALIILGQPLFKPSKGKFHLDPVYETVAQEQGLLLLSTPLYDFVQLKTRRPILFNPYALDGLPYAPETVAGLNEMLEKIYGLSLRGTLADKHKHQLLNLGLEKELWEERKKADWLKIRREFGVKQILTKADWRLDLPVVARSARFILYAIPEK